jgi:hypothetical protein
MPSHQLGEGGLAAPRLIGGEQVVVAGISQTAHFFRQSQVAEVQAKGAAHSKNAPDRMSLEMILFDGVQLGYFAEKWKEEITVEATEPRPLGPLTKRVSRKGAKNAKTNEINRQDAKSRKKKSKQVAFPLRPLRLCEKLFTVPFGER